MEEGDQRGRGRGKGREDGMFSLYVEEPLVRMGLACGYAFGCLYTTQTM